MNVRVQEIPEEASVMRARHLDQLSRARARVAHQSNYARRRLTFRSRMAQRRTVNCWSAKPEQPGLIAPTVQPNQLVSRDAALSTL
jgi:hypothetical protein